MSTIPVNPKVLKWARNQRSLSLEDAAKRLDIPIQELESYEKGAILPNVTFLRNMASSYEIPLVTLLMPDTLPPQEQLKDFRTLEGHPAELTFEVTTAIDEVKFYLDGLVDIVQENPSLYAGVKFRQFLPDKNEVAKFASEERQHLLVTTQQQIRWRDSLEAFRQWRYKLEGIGIFVYLMKMPDANRIRGFSMLYQNHIPVIVVNDREEYYQPKIFTLMHEYAHLLLRDAGICDQNPRNRVERFCNLFAANILMPIELLASVLDIPEWKPREWDDKELSQGAKRMHVSREALTLRLQELKLTPPGYYEKKKEEWDQEERRTRKPGGRSTQAERCLRKLGAGHTSLIVRALDEAKINRVDAVELLNLRPKHFPEIRELLTAKI